MKIVGKLQAVAVAVAVIAGTVGIGATSAQAATADDVASWITDAALERLGVEVQDPALAEALKAAVQSAVDSGLISTTVDDVAQSAVDDPDAVSDETVDEALDGEFDEQTGVWQDIALAWHAAFDQIKADFAECRSAAVGNATEGDATEGDATEGDATEGDATEGDATEDSATDPGAAEDDATDSTAGDATEGDATEGDATGDATAHGASECAHEFRYAMQLNHLKAWQARHDAKVARIAELPAGQREKVMANFEAQGERAVRRLEKAEAQLEKQTGDKVTGPRADRDQRGNKGHDRSDRGRNGNSQRGNSGK
ncbi:MAG TPA: hypothetical protein VIQ78_06660 [Terrimesophilobacter sp.]|uniref:hypothetical protein n=1 Tax=Terrimesophilobacter sp. TaxID=2906435 RepID=UPI002F93661F